MVRQIFAERTGQFSNGKLTGKNCMEAIFTRFRLHCLAATRLRGPLQSGVGFFLFSLKQKTYLKTYLRISQFSMDVETKSSLLSEKKYEWNIRTTPP